ncbi:DUF445 domain-containing protein [Anaerobacillus sp. MEB173]|uniref:DUF445 domain-containing protein n=1 Tax=Anaerobacillus sp. MEB173 TaxID=3383345 RepID=UPI003F903AA0
MEALLVIFMMIAIGAIIGGFTNSLAIKMLFRPYKALYIGKWRVPFTPGLIPKRRGELANQMGQMVVNHLLTPEGLEKKLNDSSFKKEMVNWVQQETRQLLHSKESVETIVQQYFHIEDLQRKVENKAETLIEQKFEQLLSEYGQQQIDQVLPVSWIKKGDDLVPKLTAQILDKAKNYFNSPEGKEQLSVMIDRFLMGRGTLGNMISMFLGNDRLVDKVQPEVIKLLNDYATYDFLEKLIAKEWTSIKSWKIADVVKKIDQNELLNIIKAGVLKQLQLEKWLKTPLVEWTGQYEKAIVDEWVPKITENIVQVLSKRLGQMMKKMRLADVVKEQVETFSVDRLETMVLSISRREFKMITYLGAVLGGCIGFIQGIIVLFIK